MAAALAPRLRRSTQQSTQVGRKAERGCHKVTQGLSHSLDTSWTIIITHAHTRHTQAQQELDEAKEVFDLLNDQLVREIPILLEQRVPYFDPSFEAMIRMQCKFAEEGYEKLSGVQRYFEDSVRDDYAAGQLDAQVEGVLQEMRELSIYGTG